MASSPATLSTTAAPNAASDAAAQKENAAGNLPIPSVDEDESPKIPDDGLEAACACLELGYQKPGWNLRDDTFGWYHDQDCEIFFGRGSVDDSGQYPLRRTGIDTPQSPIHEQPPHAPVLEDKAGEHASLSTSGTSIYTDGKDSLPSENLSESAKAPAEPAVDSAVSVGASNKSGKYATPELRLRRLEAAFAVLLPGTCAVSDDKVDRLRSLLDVLCSMAPDRWLPWKCLLEFSDVGVQTLIKRLPLDTRVGSNTIALEYRSISLDKPSQFTSNGESNEWFRKACFESGALAQILAEHPEELWQVLDEITLRHAANNGDNSTAGHVLGQARYVSGRCLAMYFEHNDIHCEDEAFELRECIEHHLGFPVELCKIPRQEPQKYLFHRLKQFISENKRPNEQLIFHYGGHGEKHPTKKELWIFPTRAGGREINMSFVIEELIMKAEQEVGILLDCCYAGAALRGDNSSRKEVLTAGNLTTVVAGVHDKTSMTAFFMMFIKHYRTNFSFRQIHQKLLLLHHLLGKSQSEPQWQVLSDGNSPEIVLSPIL